MYGGVRLLRPLPMGFTPEYSDIDFFSGNWSDILGITLSDRLKWETLISLYARIADTLSSFSLGSVSPLVDTLNRSLYGTYNPDGSFSSSGRTISSFKSFAWRIFCLLDCLLNLAVFITFDLSRDNVNSHTQWLFKVLECFRCQHVRRGLALGDTRQLHIDRNCWRLYIQLAFLCIEGLSEEID